MKKTLCIAGVQAVDRTYQRQVKGGFINTSCPVDCNCVWVCSTTSVVYLRNSWCSGSCPDGSCYPFADCF
jgi:hypothetical protein